MRVGFRNVSRIIIAPTTCNVRAERFRRSLHAFSAAHTYDMRPQRRKRREDRTAIGAALVRRSVFSRSCSTGRGGPHAGTGRARTFPTTRLGVVGAPLTPNPVWRCSHHVRLARGPAATRSGSRPSARLLRMSDLRLVRGRRLRAQARAEYRRVRPSVAHRSAGSRAPRSAPAPGRPLTRARIVRRAESKSVTRVTREK